MIDGYWEGHWDKLERGASDKELLDKITAKKPIPEVVTRGKVLELSEKLKSPGLQAFYYFLYLTGCRISEGLMVKRDDVQGEMYKGEKIITIRIPTLKKRRGTKFRVIPIHASEEKNPLEFKMWDAVKPFVSRTERGHIFIRDEDSSTNVRMRVAQAFRRHIILTTRAVHRSKFIDEYTFGLYPHYLRHCRLTHLAQIYGFDALKLTNFAGWSSIAPATIYLHYNWIDLARFMVSK